MGMVKEGKLLLETFSEKKKGPKGLSVMTKKFRKRNEQNFPGKTLFRGEDKKRDKKKPKRLVDKVRGKWRTRQQMKHSGQLDLKERS